MCYFDYNYEEDRGFSLCSIRRNIYLLQVFLNCYLTTYSGYEDIPLLVNFGHLGYNISSFVNTKELFVKHMKKKKKKLSKMLSNKTKTTVKKKIKTTKNKKK